MSISLGPPPQALQTKEKWCNLPILTSFLGVFLDIFLGFRVGFKTKKPASHGGHRAQKGAHELQGAIAGHEGCVKWNEG